MSTNTNPEKLKQIVEGALLAAGRPLSIDQLLTLFMDEEQPGRDEIRAVLNALQDECADRGVELKEVSSGFRYQVKADLAQWIARLWEEKPSRYSRATLETLALIAYRQPITRSEIEDVRGVSVSSNIIKSLLEREWIRVIGHRDVPGKPALYGTTKTFLDYFSLKSLSDLPPLAELRNIDSIEREFDFGDKQGQGPEAANDTDEESGRVEPVPLDEEGEEPVQVTMEADDPEAEAETAETEAAPEADTETAEEATEAEAEEEEVTTAGAEETFRHTGEPDAETGEESESTESSKTEAAY
jgi:segregation and condensation protein B